MAVNMRHFIDTMRTRDELLDTIDRLRRDLAAVEIARDELRVIVTRQAEQIEALQDILRNWLPLITAELHGADGTLHPEDAAALTMIYAALGEDRDDA